MSNGTVMVGNRECVQDGIFREMPLAAHDGSWVCGASVLTSRADSPRWAARHSRMLRTATAKGGR